MTFSRGTAGCAATKFMRLSATSVFFSSWESAAGNEMVDQAKECCRLVIFFFLILYTPPKRYASPAAKRGLRNSACKIERWSDKKRVGKGDTRMELLIPAAASLVQQCAS